MLMVLTYFQVKHRISYVCLSFTTIIVFNTLELRVFQINES
jgi:hypothetical protein